jgi:hypothetical protein
MVVEGEGGRRKCEHENRGGGFFFGARALLTEAVGGVSGAVKAIRGKQCEGATVAERGVLTAVSKDDEEDEVKDAPHHLFRSQGYGVVLWSAARSERSRDMML